MANFNLTQTGDEVQAYIDSIPVIDVTGTLSGSTITFGSNPYSQIAANYAADCGSIVRLTVGTAVYLLRVTQYDGTNYTAAEMSGAHNVVATIGSSSASATIDAGIDTTPTQGSENLVKSGGVYEEISQLDQKMDELLIELMGFGTSGAEGGAVNNGDIYYNTNTKLLRKCTSDGGSSYETVPYLSGAIYTCNGFLYIWNGTDLVSLEKELQESVVKKKGYGSGNLIDPDKFTEGYAIFASSGNISGGRTGFLVTDYIPVSGKGIISNALFNSTWGGAVYDSSKSLLRPLTTSQYTYTSGDAYIRLTFQTSTAGKSAFYGTLLKPFSEFDPIAEYYEKDSAFILNAVTPLDVLPAWKSGYMVNPNNGSLAVDQNSYYTDYIKVSSGKQVKTNIVIGGNRGVAFYNESGGYVSGLNTYANGEFSVPAGAYYMRMSTVNTAYQSGVFVRVCGWIDEAIDKHTDAINALEKGVAQMGVTADWIQGKMINLSNGNAINDASSYCTDFIQTEEGKSYATNVVIGGNRSIGFYNSSKSFISGINSLTNGQFTTPAGTAYMRVSTTSSSYSAGVYIREIGWISNGIAKNAGDISNIQDVLTSVKIATSWEAGKFINYSNGYIDSSSSYALSDYIKVTAGKSYRTNIHFNGNAGACFYNANKVKVGGVNVFDEVAVENGVTLYSIISVPDGASYIRSSHYLNSGIATTAIFFQEVDGIDYNCSNNKEASIVALDMMRDVIVQSVEANPYKLVPAGKSYIAFTFDDGEASNSDMVDLFHQKGVPLCLAIPRQRLKTMCLNGKTIAENCLAVEADGGEILTHSLFYMDANSTEDDIRAFFEWNKAGLLEAGLHPWGVVNAGGGAELGSVPNLEWLKRYAYSTHEYGLFFTALTDNVHFNFVRHGLGSRLSVLKDYVDERIALHAPIIFNAHAPYDVDPDNLDGGWVQKISDLLDYITTNYTSSDFEFCNIKTWMRNCQKTAAQLYFDTL